MKVAVISDTHAHNINQLSKDLLNTLRQADYVIHLGDFDSKELVDEFRSWSNFRGVTGNHDKHDIKAILPELDIVEINGKKLGLVHGHGCTMPFGLKNGLKSRFNDTKLDAILYGHTHVTTNITMSGILYFNPGSACGRFPAYHRSYGLLEVGDSITGQIIPIRESKKRTIGEHIYALAQEIEPKKVYYRMFSPR
jgi:putative phosphoesterase